MSGLRKAPKLSFDNIKTLSSQAFFLAATHVAGVISFGAGAISFTHILKATEPVWSALILGVLTSAGLSFVGANHGRCWIGFIERIILHVAKFHSWHY